MRVNALIASIASLLIGVMFFLFGRNFTIYLIVSLVLAGVFLALFIFYKKISFMDRLPSKIPLLILTIMVCLTMCFFALICIINYPLEGDFEEKLIFTLATEEEYKNGEELFVLLMDFNDLFDSLNIEVKDDDLDAYAVEFLEKTASKRKGISKFIKTNDIAVSASPRIELKYNSFTEQDNEEFVESVINFINIELVEVKTLQNQGKGREAANKYMDLWRTIDAIVAIRSTNFQYAMLYSYIVAQMGDYYYNNQEELNKYNFSSISNITENILEKLDKSYENLIIADYNIVKVNKQEVTEILKWPFFDLNRTLKKYHDYFYSMIERLNSPYDDTITYEKPLKKVNYFTKNPTGEVQYAEEIEKFEMLLFDQIIKNYINRKTEIGVYMYAINYKKNAEDIPKDYKTGGEVQIKDHGDVVEIFTGGSDSRERKFEIIK